MSSTCKKIETRIQKIIEYLNKNPKAKRAKTAREFDVPLDRLRSRLENNPFATSIREMHRRRLSPEQNLALKLYLQQLIKLGLHSRLRMMKAVANKLLMQNCIESENRPLPLIVSPRVSHA
jgi:hypothetical protein